MRRLCGGQAAPPSTRPRISASGSPGGRRSDLRRGRAPSVTPPSKVQWLRAPMERRRLFAMSNTLTTTKFVLCFYFSFVYDFYVLDVFLKNASVLAFNAPDFSDPLTRHDAKCRVCSCVQVLRLIDSSTPAAPHTPVSAHRPPGALGTKQIATASARGLCVPRGLASPLSRHRDPSVLPTSSTGMSMPLPGSPEVPIMPKLTSSVFTTIRAAACASCARRAMRTNLRAHARANQQAAATPCAKCQRKTKHAWPTKNKKTHGIAPRRIIAALR